MAKTTLLLQLLLFVSALNASAIDNTLTREQLLGIAQAIIVLTAVSHGLGRRVADLAESATVMAEKVRDPTFGNAFPQPLTLL